TVLPSRSKVVSELSVKNFRLPRNLPVFRLFGGRNAWIPGDSDCLTDLLILYVAQPKRASSFRCSSSRERDDRSSSQDWSQIDLHFVDDPVAECVTENFAATFDQHASDVAFAQILQH